MIIAFDEAGVFHFHNSQPKDDRDHPNQNEAKTQVATKAARVEFVFNFQSHVL